MFTTGETFHVKSNMIGCCTGLHDFADFHSDCSSGLILAQYIISSPWWRHQMRTFSALQAFLGGSPHKGQWRGAFMFSLTCAWTNGWANSPLTVMSGWVSNYIHYTVRYEISYPLPNFNGAVIEFWEWIRNFTQQSHTVLDMWLHMPAGI